MIKRIIKKLAITVGCVTAVIIFIQLLTTFCLWLETIPMIMQCIIVIIFTSTLIGVFIIMSELRKEKDERD